MERSVLVRLRADISDYQRKFGEAAQGAKTLAKESSTFLEKNEQSIDKVSNKLGLLGAGLTGIAAVAVKKFADFDQAISAVESTGTDAARSIGQLREAALDAGARTVYSATEAAGAVENLAKAGISAADVLGGALDGSLDLAAAGGLAVADAAEIAATTLTQFNLRGDKAAHVADVLAAGAGKAQGSVADMALAMSYAGIPAAQLGVSLEETAGTLGLFAKNGIVGEKAGTSLRSMIASLTAPSKVAQRAMDELNFSVFDGQGKFIGFEGVAGLLQARLGKLTQEERSYYLGRIFGNEAMQAANVLTAQGAAAVAEWTQKVDDQGYAADVAATKLDNLKGDWEGFTGALDTAFISTGEAANGPLRDLVQTATDVVNAFSDAPDSVHQVTLALVGGGGLIALGLAGLGKLVIGVNETKIALDALKISGRTAAVAVGAIGGVLAIGTIALMAWADANATAEARVDGLRGSLDKTTGAVTRDTRAWLANNLTTRQGILFLKQDSVADSAKVIGLSLDTITDAILGNTDAIRAVKSATTGYTVENGKLAEAAEAAGVSISEYSAAMDIVKGQVGALTGSLADSRTEQKDVNEAVDEGVVATEAATGAITEQVDALKDLIEAQAEAAGVVLSERDAQRQLEESYRAVTEALQQQVDDLAAHYVAQGLGEDAAKARAEAEVAVAEKLDITTEAGSRNQAALDDVANAGWDLIAAMKANGATQDELQATMQTTRDRFVGVAQQMGLSADAANALADQLGLIPRNVSTNVAVDVGDAQVAINSFITSNTGRRIRIGVDAVGGTTLQFSPGGPKATAENGALYAFANGAGVDATGRTVPRVSQIQKGGANILWAEPATDWEAYISGKPSMRNRNLSIWEETGRRLGVGGVPTNVHAYADGAFTGPRATAEAQQLPDGLRIVGKLDMGNGLYGLIDARVAEGQTSQQRTFTGSRGSRS